MIPGIDIWVGAAALLNGTAAGLCARDRDYGMYVTSIAAVALVLLLGLGSGVPHHGGILSVVADVLWILPLPLLFSVFPGLLVKEGAGFALAFVAGFATTLVAAVPFLFYGVVLLCSVGGDCL